MQGPRRLLVPLVAVLALHVPVTAHAGPKDDAQAHIAKAMDAHEHGDFALAAKELQAAYALDPNADLLYAIGQVYVKLDRCDEAVSYYERYLATKPPAQATVDTQEAIATCKAKAPAVTAPEPAPSTPEPAPTAMITKARPPAPRWYTDRIGGALVGTGVVASIVGVVVYRQAVSDLDAAEAAPSLDQYEGLVDRAGSRRTYSAILIGAGAAFIGAGIVRYLLVRRDAEDVEQGLAVVPTQGGAFVTWGGEL